MASIDLISLGVEIIEAMERQGICVRMLGSAGISVACEKTLQIYPQFRRTPNDLDLAGYSQDSELLEKHLKMLGFEPAKEFNYLNADRRLIYFRGSDRIKIDIFLDEFRMCHRFLFEGRLMLAPLTLPLTDLLLTKLQIVEFTHRDLLDSYAMLLQAGVDPGAGVSHDTSSLDLVRIVDLCSHDWGWYWTFSRNLAFLVANPPPGLDDCSFRAVSQCANKLTAAIKNSKKSMAWRLRALLGDRLRWYEYPENPYPLIVGGRI